MRVRSDETLSSLFELCSVEASSASTFLFDSARCGRLELSSRPVFWNWNCCSLLFVFAETEMGGLGGCGLGGIEPE